MFIIVLALLILGVGIFLERKWPGSSKNDDAPEENSSGDKKAELNQEILAELEKAEPDYAKLKRLRTEMNQLGEKQKSETVVSSQAVSATKTEASGLSVALYIGSLLILAGVGGLVFSGAKTYGLIILIMMMLVFYVGGIMMRKSEKLKSASYVFVGTGMAIIPFIGVLFYNIVGENPEIIWLAMSLVGLPAYILAAYIMQNKVFAYFAILGFVSLGCSMSATMSLPLVWYFVSAIALGIVFDLLRVFGVTKKFDVLMEPVDQAGEWLPMAAFVASLFAIGNISELEYVIMFAVVLAQIALNLWKKPTIWQENLFRLLALVWLMMLTHLIDPSLKAMGLTLAGGALVEVLYSFYRIAKGVDFTPGRREFESVWLVVAMLCFVAAGIMVGEGNVTKTWGWSLGATLVDVTIIFCARFGLQRNYWYVGLILAAICLPVMLMNLIGLDGKEFVWLYVILYISEMALLEIIFWWIKGQEGNILLGAALAALGIAALIAGWTQSITTPVYAAVAIGFGVNGVLKKQRISQEISLYVTVATILSAIGQLRDVLPDGIVMPVIFAHVIYGGFAIASLIWEKNAPKIRLLVGNILLLMTVGTVAMSPTAEWAMYLFILEAVVTLAYGLALRFKPIWIAGAVAVFLAVLWFTKDLPFVFPVLLGLAVIATVVVVLLKKDSGGKAEIQKPWG